MKPAPLESTPNQLKVNPKFLIVDMCLALFGTFLCTHSMPTLMNTALITGDKQLQVVLEDIDSLDFSQIDAVTINNLARALVLVEKLSNIDFGNSQSNEIRSRIVTHLDGITEILSYYRVNTTQFTQEDNMALAQLLPQVKNDLRDLSNSVTTNLDNAGKENELGFSIILAAAFFLIISILLSKNAEYQALAREAAIFADLDLTLNKTITQLLDEFMERLMREEIREPTPAQSKMGIGGLLEDGEYIPTDASPQLSADYNPQSLQDLLNTQSDNLNVEES